MILNFKQKEPTLRSNNICVHMHEAVKDVTDGHVLRAVWGAAAHADVATAIALWHALVATPMGTLTDRVRTVC